MVDITHQLVMIADSTSETWWELVDDASGGREVIYRSEIHAALAEISHMCDFGPLVKWSQFEPTPDVTTGASYPTAVAAG